MRMRSFTASIVVAGVLVSGVGVGVAGAESLAPWWGLTAGARPTSLHASTVDKDEVQELSFAAEGAFDLYTEQNGGRQIIGPFQTYPYLFGGVRQATAAVVQAALESPELYGAGNVEVTGGPAGSAPLLIKSVNGDGAEAVSPLLVHPLIGTGEAKVLEPGEGDGQSIVVTAQNLGDAPAISSAQSPVVVEDTLPAGVKAFGAQALLYAGTETVPVPCGVSGQVVRCEVAPGGSLASYEMIEVRIPVSVNGSAGGEVNTASISGGGAVRAASASKPLSVGEEPRFGFEGYSVLPEAVGGGVDTQAGSHPFQVTTTILLNQTVGEEPVRLPKDVGTVWPAGLLGDPQVVPQCSELEFNTQRTQGEGGGANQCPGDTAVGVALITYRFHGKLYNIPSPLFNLVPVQGEPARLGFLIQGIPIVLRTSVRPGGDYGVDIVSENITQISGLLGVRITAWGVPDASAHDSSRGWECLEAGIVGHELSCPAGEGTAPPFLSMPTSCEEPFASTVSGDSWAAPGFPQQVAELQFPLAGQTPPVRVDGCDALPFTPEITVKPDVTDGSTPSGLEVAVKVPQKSILDGESLAEGTVRDTTVALPAGMALNPGGAGGLEACSEGQVGYTGKLATDAAWLVFTPSLSEPFCPDGSKVGTVEIETPLLPQGHALKGAVYIADPAPNGEGGLNPFNGLVAMYLVAEDPVSGALIKLAGQVFPCQNTGESFAGVRCEAPGQLISTFEDTPQIPFENLRIHFFGGSRAPLATPALCGSYTTHASFVPWSYEPGGTVAQAESTFNITSGPNGGSCADPQPFAPEFQAGSTNIQAGGFTELLTTMGHPDADQTLGGLSIKLPPGLSGLLSSVKLCGEAEANAGTCGPESLIGHTVVTAGLGSTPVVVKRPGGVYITGPYKGAPFGLSIVNPAEAGPFNLGNVVVRAKIEVNPTTAALTITSDALPTIIKGIPLDIQHVQVAISKEVNGGKDFTFNPTNCEPQKIEGSISSSEGATAPVSSAFQATNCATLKFTPKFAVSTQGKTSRTGGASLSVKLTEPPGSVGTQANIKEVKVELPAQLPSRLPTLQKACTAAQFNQNPAGCPAPSIVGHVVVHTPLIPVPLEGPAYFVSNGGSGWPSLIMVLQGYGVTVELVGETHITGNVTSTTFHTIPDVPFSTFELTLPEGPYSALTTESDLCATTRSVLVKKKVAVKVHGRRRTVTRTVREQKPATLQMPVEFNAQNGAAVHQTTNVSVTGCPKAAAARKAAKKHKQRNQKGGKRK